MTLNFHVEVECCMIIIGLLGHSKNGQSRISECRNTFILIFPLPVSAVQKNELLVHGDYYFQIPGMLILTFKSHLQSSLQNLQPIIMKPYYNMSFESYKTAKLHDLYFSF